MVLGLGTKESAEPRTIQEGKDDFQVNWGKGFSSGWGEDTAPLPMSTQAFVNEIITTVTIAQNSPNFGYSSLFGLGFEVLGLGFACLGVGFAVLVLVFVV